MHGRNRFARQLIGGLVDTTDRSDSWKRSASQGVSVFQLADHKH